MNLGPGPERIHDRNTIIMVPISSQKTKSQTSINSAGSHSSGRAVALPATLIFPNNGIFAWMRVFRYANLLVQAGC
ncbi:UNVERIFIED_CONTAM: hypothetical protein PYX00_003423 [Menopon gallinae]|uniref:Uncharacterized protein n=1 Tax=Menopon gallinae TaxID=328185 RepID=A0AAW2I082_9NEOP